MAFGLKVLGHTEKWSPECRALTLGCHIYDFSDIRLDTFQAYSCFKILMLTVENQKLEGTLEQPGSTYRRLAVHREL